ncbi:nitrous oxide reductase accessory protein NosL [Oceanithermus sp.]|uniref:nitrous oxide reductase accessory protein NosL n=1 Tax=Oceanithermus sp. TaxID=2268145 RepID=UPI00257B45AB|nr:nitrous oxide reductase accessory protein NosL [Oceanithermus sp.]
MKRRDLLKGLIGLGVPWSLGVLAEARPVRVGVDVCPYCNMTVIDARYAAQMVTRTGKVYSYDAIECLVDHLNGYGGPKAAPRELYAADFAASRADRAGLRAVDGLVFLYHRRIRTPMGGGLVAFARPEDADRFVQERRLKGVRRMRWDELVAEGRQHAWVPPY